MHVVIKEDHQMKIIKPAFNHYTKHTP